MIFSISVVGQIIIVEHGGVAFQTVPLEKDNWILCILIGLISIPIGVLIRLIPDDLIIVRRQQRNSNNNVNISSHSLTVQRTMNQRNEHNQQQQQQKQQEQDLNSKEKRSNNEYEPIHWSINIV